MMKVQKSEKAAREKGTEREMARYEKTAGFAVSQTGERDCGSSLIPL